MYDAQKAAKILLEYTRYKGYGYVYIELHKHSCLGVRVVGDFSNDNRDGFLNRLKERKYRLEYN